MGGEGTQQEALNHCGHRRGCQEQEEQNWVALGEEVPMPEHHHKRYSAEKEEPEAAEEPAEPQHSPTEPHSLQGVEHPHLLHCQ